MSESVFQQVVRKDAAVTMVRDVEIAQRFNCGIRRARNLVRDMKHLRHGRELLTTEQWLAEWAASQALPGRNWPKPLRDRDPMDRDVILRAIELIGELSKRGMITVHGAEAVFGERKLLQG